MRRLTSGWSGPRKSPAAQPQAVSASLKAVARRLRIEYADQNEEFARYLPRVGAVEREFRDTTGGGPWFLVRLEEPFEYQLRSGDLFQYRLTHVDAFLIRSRWEGHEVGDRDGVSVFVLLVERDRPPVGDEIDVHNFVHIAWGTCRPEA